MVVNDKVEVNISNRNISHYKKFYNDIKLGKMFVDFNNIPKGSDLKVKVLCEKCNIIIEKKVNNLYRDRLNNDGLDTCDHCGRIRIAEGNRIKYEKVRNLFIERDLIPLFKEDDKVSTNNKLDFKCKIHNNIVQSIRYNGLLVSKRPCKLCRSESISERNKKSYEEVYNYFLNRDLIPVFDEVNSIFDKLSFRCKSHIDIIQEISYNSLKFTKNGCKICFNKKCENSTNWKGGITPLVRNMRSKVDKWKFEKMKKSNFKCEITGKNGKLVVHHVENFHKLLENSLKINNLEVKPIISDYTSDELINIEKELIKLHEQVEYSVMIEELHILFHKLYGKKNNNKYQFIEFKNRYYNYELDKYLTDYKFSIVYPNHYQL